MKLRYTLIAAAAMTLGACATANTEPKATFTSDRTPEQIAFCLDSSLRGGVRTERVSPGYVVAERRNTYGMPMVRWDIRESPRGGSVIEYRVRAAVNTGSDKAKDCFEGVA